MAEETEDQEAEMKTAEETEDQEAEDHAAQKDNEKKLTSIRQRKY